MKLTKNWDDAFHEHSVAQGKVVGMPGLNARPCFKAGWDAALAAQAAATREDALNAARWQFMVEVSAGPPARNTYAAALNEQHFFLHWAPERRKAAFIAAVDKARQQMAGTYGLQGVEHGADGIT